MYVSGVETLSDSDESEGSQVRVESEKEGSGESEMEISGESDEESSSESSGDSDVIDVQLDSAEAGPNRHSGKISTRKVAHYHAVIIISCVLLLTSAGKVHTMNF